MIALLELWWKPIALVLAGVAVFLGFKAENLRVQSLQQTVAEQRTQIEAADSVIRQQNAAIDEWKAKGAEQQATIEGLAKEAQEAAGKVEVQWKTKYVPTPIPVDCSAAVAAGAVNAASAARIFMSQTK